jgi:hypothetical protein
MDSQKQKVLEHLNKYGCINIYLAMIHYKIWRLASIIHKLRNAGYKIVSQRRHHCKRGSYIEYISEKNFL